MLMTLRDTEIAGDRIGRTKSAKQQGFEAQAGTPEEFTAIINREIEQTVKLIQITGLKAE